MTAKLEPADRAKEFARQYHERQTDKLGVAYIHHLADVASRVANESETVKCIAWLHDCVEDTPATLQQIKSEFGSLVRDGVDAMTKRPGERYFEEYLPRLILQPNAVPEKIADATHNYGKAHLLAANDPDGARRLALKYHKVLRFLGVRDPRPERIIFHGDRWQSSHA